MYYSFYKRGQTNAAVVVKHKHQRANVAMVQAILCTDSFYERVQTNASFVAKHKRRRVNLRRVQTPKTGLQTKTLYVPLACAENCAILASPKTGKTLD